MRSVGVRTAVVVAALAPAGAAHGAQAPRFAGSVAVDYSLTPTSGRGTATGVPGDGFTGRYAVGGPRWTARYAPKNSYLLTGKGTERLDASCRFDLASGSSTQTITFSATAVGDVRLVKKVRGLAQTSGLILTLLPKGRFTLSLESLLGDGGGLPLTYVSDVDSKGPCDGGGVGEVKSTYDSGLYTVKSLSVCPGYTPTDRTEGAKEQLTIWGASVWTTEGFSGTPRPDLCRGRIDPFNPTLICGRVGRGGRIRGQWAIGPYSLVGLCPFFPLTTEGIVPPPVTEPDGSVVDPVSDGCTFGSGDAGWRAKLTVRWSLRRA